MKSLWPVGAPRLVRLFNSWGTRWKHRKGFKEFEQAVDDAIKNDEFLMELRKLRKNRINEIIVEVGKKT